MKTAAGCVTLGMLLMVSPGDDHGGGIRDLVVHPSLARRSVSFFGQRARPGSLSVAPARQPSAADVAKATSPIPAGAAVDMIGRLKDIFASEGVPSELVWLAEVESALDPHAISHAGAAGLFQFMPATARRFGLHVGADYDERFDPAKSARAAARYLRTLYSQFGSWPLAVAAYNAGEGRVSRVLSSERAWTYEQIERCLPSQTRQYVPRVMNIIAWEEGIRSDEIAAPRT